jgi:hypothetical protein
MKTDHKSMAWEEVCWTELVPDRDNEGGICEDGNEPLVSIKGGKFLGYRKKYLLFKDDVPCI